MGRVRSHGWVRRALRALLARHRSAEVGRRPVVVLSRDAVVPRHRRALVAPCTTTLRGLVSEVLLEPGEDPVPWRCAVDLDSVESVSTTLLVQRAGRLAEARVRQVCQALATAVGCPG